MYNISFSKTLLLMDNKVQEKNHETTKTSIIILINSYLPAYKILLETFFGINVNQKK